MRILRLKPYLRAMKEMGLTEQDLVRIETDIARAPETHPMVQGLRGARRARFALPGRGKRGGGRTFYYAAMAPGVLFMMAAYPKNERDDLSPDQRKAILDVIASIKDTDR
ncbi:type II toxin-antitoxin system RelE/ParE family toxin [Methylobacterium sp. ID0610]|uniref:type II toxin-antitoxin system RelE/ParE family toxin n=1 Tax=Methylobacterium carpenticola TaxID=3344827 RepID=UPI00367C57A4